MIEKYRCCCDCKFSEVGFRETFICTNPHKHDKEPMYDAFDTCDKWEFRDDFEEGERMRQNPWDIAPLDDVIKAFEAVDKSWENAVNQVLYPDFRDALMYLKRYRDEQKRPVADRLIDVLREVREEK